MSELVPSAAVRRLAPGENATVVFTARSGAADAAMTARIEGGDGAFEILEFQALRAIKVPFSEEELREFHPPAFRERMRREGKTEFVSDTAAGPGDSIEVSAGAQLTVRVEFRGGASKGRVAAGALVLAGLVERQASLGMVVGTGMGACTVTPPELRAVVAPGGEVRRTVAISDIAVDTVGLATINAPTGGLSIGTITVFKTTRISFTEEELAEFPEPLREQMRREGHLQSAPVQTASAGDALHIPAGGRVQIEVVMRAPREAQDIDGVLHFISDRLAPVEVRILPRQLMFSVSLESDRVEVTQGSDTAAELVADLHLRGGSPADVEMRLGQAGEPWFIQTVVEAVPVATGASSKRVRLQVRVPPESPVGEHHTFLHLLWNEGVGAFSVPVTVVIGPGFAAVRCFAPQFSGNQGGRARVGIRVDVESRKQVRFTPVWLPPGLVLLPPGRQAFEPGRHAMDLEFAVDENSPVYPDGPVVVDWDALDGIHRGRLALRASVLLTRQERRFARPIVTPDGIPLRGEAGFVLSNDGTGRFFGHMRATGALSFGFQVVATIRSADGQIAVVKQKIGEVFGTDQPFRPDRQTEWDEPFRLAIAPEHWGLIATGELAVSRSFRFEGIVGTALDAVTKLVDILSSLSILAPVPGGTALAVLFFAASEFGDLTGLKPLNPAGLPGLLTTSGASFVLGPSVALPVFVGTALLGELLIKHRGLTREEKEFADQVFKGSINYDRIVITNLVGIGDVPFVIPAPDASIMVNLGAAFFDPRNFRKPNGVPGHTFIHELTHAWQIEHNAIDTEFFWRALVNKPLRTAPYNYGPPDSSFSDFGLEGQASVVEEWFGGMTGHAPDRQFPDGRQRMSESDPYFHYITENIRLGAP